MGNEFIDQLSRDLAVDYFGSSKEDQKDERRVEEMATAVSFISAAAQCNPFMEIMPREVLLEAVVGFLEERPHIFVSSLFPAAPALTEFTPYCSSVFIQARIYDYLTAPPSQPRIEAELRWVLWCWDGRHDHAIEMTNSVPLRRKWGAEKLDLIVAVLLNNAKKEMRRYFNGTTE